MIKHIIVWKLKEEFSEEEKKEIKETFKTRLEALVDKIEGVEKIEVIIDPLESSNMDLMLDSEFINEEALNAYQVFPEHVEISSYLKERVVSRNCMDYKY